MRRLILDKNVLISSHGYDEPAVLITAYVPDPLKWDDTFTRRYNDA